MHNASSPLAAGHPATARHVGRPHGLRRSVAVALTLLGLALAGTTVAAAADGALVATLTKAGRGGHPYHWALPSC